MKIKELFDNHNVKSKFIRKSDSEERVFSSFDLKKLRVMAERLEKGTTLNPIFVNRKMLEDAFADDWEKVSG